MYTLYNEEEDRTIYVLSGKDYFDELVQDAMDFDIDFWRPDESQFYTVNGQLVEVLDSQSTVEEAIENAREYDGLTYELVNMSREIKYGVLTESIDKMIELYWGVSAYGSEIEYHSKPEECLEVYAVYNDRIDDYAQLGTLTVKTGEDFPAYKVHRELIT